MLTVCLDSNVIISGIAFSGKPQKVLQKALARNFNLVLGPTILEEVRRNLVGKLGVSKKMVDAFFADLLKISSLYVPGHVPQITANKGDNIVLEVCRMGQCDVLVTGDKKDLLPLSSYRGTIIEPPSKFLERLEAQTIL